MTHKFEWIRITLSKLGKQVAIEELIARHAAATQRAPLR